MKNALVCATALLLLATRAHACAVCMGAPGTPQAEGVNAALWTMLGTLSGVFGIGAYFVGRMIFLSNHTDTRP